MTGYHTENCNYLLCGYWGVDETLTALFSFSTRKKGKYEGISLHISIVHAEVISGVGEVVPTSARGVSNISLTVVG